MVAGGDGAGPADLTRAAPLSDHELLGVVRRALAEVVLPELERRGADEFVLAQVRSTMSIVGFVQRGHRDRVRAADRAAADLDDLTGRVGEPLAGAVTPGQLARALDQLGPAEGAELRRLLDGRLAIEMASRLGHPGPEHPAGPADRED